MLNAWFPKPKHVSALIVFQLGMASLAQAQDNAQPRQPRATYVPGEFVVQFRPQYNAAQAAANLVPATSGAQVVRTFAKLNAAHIRVPVPAGGGVAAAAATQRVQAAVAQNPTVQIVERNYLYYQAGAAADQHGLNDSRAGELWYLEKISAFRGWQVQDDSPEVIVAVIDTGIFRDHEDLKNNFWTNEREAAGAPGVDDDNNGFIDDVHGWDFFNNDADSSPDLVEDTDLFGNPDPGKPKIFEAHGTHVSGTIGALANDKGIVGITRKVKIMPLKFLGGAEGSGSLAGAAAAVDYAAANGARIISASWAGGGQSQILRNSIEGANNAGILFVAAAGNETQNNDRDPSFPANYDVPNILAIAATGKDDRLADFSNFGRTRVNLAAPGVDILSCIPVRQGNANVPSSGYASFQGTSMATPIVSGTAALLMAHFPSLSHVDVRALLMSTVDEVDALKDEISTGGRLNVAKALSPPIPRSEADAPGVAAAAAESPANSLMRVRMHLTPVPFKRLNQEKARDRDDDRDNR